MVVISKTVIVVNAESEKGYLYHLAIRGRLLHWASDMVNIAMGFNHIEHVWCDTYAHEALFQMSTGQTFPLGKEELRWVEDTIGVGSNDDIRWPF